MADPDRVVFEAGGGEATMMLRPLLGTTTPPTQMCVRGEGRGGNCARLRFTFEDFDLEDLDLDLDVNFNLDLVAAAASASSRTKQ